MESELQKKLRVHQPSSEVKEVLIITERRSYGRPLLDAEDVPKVEVWKKSSPVVESSPGDPY